MIYLKILCTILLLNACSGTKAVKSTEAMTETTDSSLISGDYYIRHIGDKTLENEKLKITFNPKDNTVNGFSGCNHFFGSYTVKNNEIEFDKIGSSLKFCEDTQKLEDAILDTFKHIKYYINHELELTFLNSDKQPLLTISRNLATTDVLSGNYTIHFPGNTNETPLSVTFDPKNQKINGFSGCNSFFGSYKQEGDLLVIKNLGSTRKACTKTMDLEAAVLEALQNANTIRPYENTVTLTMGDIALMKLTPQKISIEYGAYSKKLTSIITFDGKNIFIRNKTDQEPIKKSLSDADIRAINKHVNAIDLNSLKHLESPSKAFMHDGAAIATISINKNGTMYTSLAFDHLKPHPNLKPLVSLLVKLANK